MRSRPNAPTSHQLPLSEIGGDSESGNYRDLRRPSRPTGGWVTASPCSALTCARRQSASAGRSDALRLTDGRHPRRDRRLATQRIRRDRVQERCRATVLPRGPSVPSTHASVALLGKGEGCLLKSVSLAAVPSAGASRSRRVHFARHKTLSASVLPAWSWRPYARSPAVPEVPGECPFRHGVHRAPAMAQRWRSAIRLSAVAFGQCFGRRGQFGFCGGRSPGRSRRLHRLARDRGIIQVTTARQQRPGSMDGEYRRARGVPTGVRVANNRAGTSRCRLPPEAGCPRPHDRNGGHRRLPSQRWASLGWRAMAIICLVAASTVDGPEPLTNVSASGSRIHDLRLP